MKEILLTQGKIALVDDEDFEKLSKHKWHAVKETHCWYAKRQTGGRKNLITIRMHREVLGLSPGDGIKADHRDGNGLNNQKWNLRRATKAQNNRNQTGRISKKYSRFKGITRDINHERSKPWLAQITIDSKRHYIGYFHTEEAAALAYNLAAQRHFGEFARLNVL